MSAPPILFIHGAGVSSWMWQPVVDLLPGCRCLTPDLPGHGSQVGVPWESIPAAAGGLADLIRTSAPEGVAHVVGLSLGGQIALQLLADHPRVVRQAIVSGTLTIPLPGAGALGWLVRLSLPLMKNEVMVRANARGNGIPAAHLEAFRRDTMQTDGPTLAAVLRSALRFRLPPVPPDARLLVAAGRKESGLVYRSARKILDYVPAARACMAPAGGHTWNLELPGLFARMVRAWVNQEPLPPELLPFPSGLRGA